MLKIITALNKTIYNHQKIFAYITIIVPALAFVFMLIFWRQYIAFTDLLALFVMSFLAILGITVGYHRLFTHKSFETNRTVKIILGVLGSIAVQGPILYWVAIHRRHHRYSDKENDPHSPILDKNSLKGFLHAHMGWIINFQPTSWVAQYIPDLLKDKDVVTLSSLYLVLLIAGIIVPGAIVGMLTLSWDGFLSGILWGGLIRIFITNHITYSINSICHLYGYKSYQTNDNSRNNVIFAILALGEGWHNNHHAFPRSACFGLNSSQFDVGFWVIKLLEKFKYANNINLPSEAEKQQKILDTSN